MKRVISILSILGIVAAATLFIFLSTSTVKAPPEPSSPVIGEFEGFPLNEERSIQFEADEETLNRLPLREQRDQMLDWLLYAVVCDAGLSVEKLNQSLFDIPPIRYGYIHPIANFEYGETRSVYIGEGKVVTLLPANSSGDQRHDYLAHIADEHRKNLGESPFSLLVFDYQLNPNAQLAQLTRRQELDTQQLYTEDAGYYEVEIQSLDDLESFMEQVDDITFARVDGNRLKLAGRKIRSREYRGIRVEDVAAIWKAEREIHIQLEDFSSRWASKTYRTSSEKRRLEQQMANEWVELGIVEGSGFSLDPTYDYDGLMSFFKGIEPQLRLLASEDASPITMQDIEEAKNALAKHTEIRFPEVPFLRLAGKLVESDDFLELLFGKEISSKIERYRFQAARYDGDLQGTEVGMVLFYTDLLAKLWAIDYMGGTPDKYIEDLQAMTEVSISPIYEREMEELPSTRLWFGHQDKGFQLTDESSSLVFARNATRVYAASSNPLEPGKEVAPNAASAAFLGWWNDHYEEVAQHEQEYERLNEIMKWSLVISWLNEANKGKLLNFLQAYPVTRSNWFPKWVQKQPQLRFRKWDQVGFYERGYKETNTEAMPILYSEPYERFGKEGWRLSGGVSLAPKSLFEEREPLSKEIDGLLRRSNLDYGSPELGNQSLRTYGGVEYIFEDLEGNQVSVTSRVKEDTKLRSRYSELAHSEFKRILSQESLGLSVETRAGGDYVGNLAISRTEDGFKVGWRSQEIDVGQSLARKLSKSDNPDRVLLEDPAVEAIFKLPGKYHYLIKAWGTNRWMKIAPEEEPSAEIASGWHSRVADHERGSRILLLAWMDPGAARTELAKQDYIGIESVEGTSKVIWKSTPLPVLPEEKPLQLIVGNITINGQFDNQTESIYLPWEELPKTLQDDLTGLQSLLGESELEDIEQLQKELVISYPIPETRWENIGFIRDLESHAYDRLAADIVDSPQSVKIGLEQHLAEELRRNDRFRADDRLVKAIQHLNELLATFGPIPELTLRKRVFEANLRNAISPQLTSLILDGSLFKSLTPEVKDSLVKNRRALMKLDTHLHYDQYPQATLLDIKFEEEHFFVFAQPRSLQMRVMNSDAQQVANKVQRMMNDSPSVNVENLISQLSDEEKSLIKNEIVLPLVEHLNPRVDGDDIILEKPADSDFATLDLPKTPALRAVVSYYFRSNPIVGVSAGSTARDVEAKLQATVDPRKLKLVFSLPLSKIDKLSEPNRTQIIDQYRSEIERLKERIQQLGMEPDEVIVDLTDLPPEEAKARVQELSEADDSLVLSFWEASSPGTLEIGQKGSFTQEDLSVAAAPTPEAFVAYTGCRCFVNGWPDATIEKRGVLSLAFWENLSIGDSFRFVDGLIDKLQASSFSITNEQSAEQIAQQLEAGELSHMLKTALETNGHIVGEELSIARQNQNEWLISSDEGDLLIRKMDKRLDVHALPRAIPLMIEILHELKLPGMPVVEVPSENAMG